jgi:hypothetical protein
VSTSSYLIEEAENGQIIKTTNFKTNYLLTPFSEIDTFLVSFMLKLGAKKRTTKSGVSSFFVKQNCALSNGSKSFLKTSGERVPQIPI